MPLRCKGKRQLLKKLMNNAKNIFMNIRLINFNLLLCFLLMICSCRNENTEKSSKIEREKIFEENFEVNNDSLIQKFVIKSNKTTLIRARHGTTVVFPADCFKVPQGEDVNIHLIECFSIKNILNENLCTTTSDGEILETDGMIFLLATNHKGDTLNELKGNKRIRVTMPTKKKKEGIKIFEGLSENRFVNWIESRDANMSNSDSIIYESDLWVNIDSSESETNQNAVIKFNNESIKNENLVTYIFSISKMGWINCDRYIESKNPTELLVEINPNDKKGKFYIVFGNSNSIVVGDEMANAESKFIFRNIPKNEPITIVGMYSEEDKIFFGMKDYKVTGEPISFPALTLTSRDNLTSAMLEKFGQDIWSRPKPSL